MAPAPMPATTAELWNGRLTFDQCVVLSSRYYARLAGHSTVGLTELSRELSELMKQLDFMLKSIYVLHEQYWRTQKGGPEAFPLHRYTDFVMDLYATGFYYLAHRAQSILGSKKYVLPHVSRYRPAIGVREVRNKILEHPRSDEAVSISGTANHSHLGPRVRPSRDGQPLENGDGRGWLFADAAELIGSIADALVRAHHGLDAERSKAASSVGGAT